MGSFSVLHRANTTSGRRYEPALCLVGLVSMAGPAELRRAVAVGRVLEIVPATHKEVRGLHRPIRSGEIGHVVLVVAGGAGDPLFARHLCAIGS